MDLIGFLFGFGFLQGLLIAGVLLAIRSSHRRANGFIAGLALVIGLSLLWKGLIRSGYFLQSPSWAVLITPLDFSWGPLLYLYAHTLIGRPLRWRQALHFLPTLLFISAVITFASFTEKQQFQFLNYLWSPHKDLELRLKVLEFTPSFWIWWVDLHLQRSVFAIQFGVYCCLVLRVIKEHNQYLKQNFSSLEHMNLRWLRTLTLACILFLVLFLVLNRSHLLLAGHFDVTALLPNSPYIVLVITVYAIGIAAIFQPKLVRGTNAATLSYMHNQIQRNEANTVQLVHQPEEPTTPTEQSIQATVAQAKGTEKYQRSSLSLTDADDFQNRLLHVMEKKKLFLDSELTLPDLAEQAGLTPHQVSQVINGLMNQNFFSFVNNYRIQLVKKMLANPEMEKMPIIELALEVGFKSKSSFYDAFKRATNMSPTQYKKSLKEKVEEL